MQKKKGEKALWTIVGCVAILCGVTSFAITVRLYDHGNDNENRMIVKKQQELSINEVIEKQPSVVAIEKKIVKETPMVVTEPVKQEAKKEESVHTIKIEEDIKKEMPILVSDSFPEDSIFVFRV